MGFLQVLALRDGKAGGFHRRLVAVGEQLQRHGVRRVGNRRVDELLIQLRAQALPERVRLTELAAHAALRYGWIRVANRGWTDGSAGRGNLTRFIARSRSSRYSVEAYPGDRRQDWRIRIRRRRIASSGSSWPSATEPSPQQRSQGTGYSHCGSPMLESLWMNSPAPSQCRQSAQPLPSGWWGNPCAVRS